MNKLQSRNSCKSRKVTKGTRIQIIQMVDELHPVPTGTCGTVRHIDGLNQIHVEWDNGSTLAVIPEIDQFTVIG